MINLSAPRLQLRWTKNEKTQDKDCDWLCHYELVLPVHEHDIRYDGGGHLVIPMSAPTKRWGMTPPCIHTDGSYFCDAPRRDGAHALWDSAVLNNLPVYIITVDGIAMQFQEKDR